MVDTRGFSTEIQQGEDQVHYSRSGSGPEWGKLDLARDFFEGVLAAEHIDPSVGAVDVVGTVPFSQGGFAATGPSGVWRAPTDGLVTHCNLAVVAAPVGSGLVVQFRINGVAFQTLTVPAGTTAPVQSAPNTAFNAGDLIDVNATSVGSTTPASGVVAQFDYAAA